MEELMNAKTRYEELIERMKKDMMLAEQYKEDLISRYKASMPLEQLVTIQSQVLRTQDYVTQKFNNMVEILRGYDDICKAIEDAKAYRKKLTQKQVEIEQFCKKNGLRRQTEREMVQEEY